MSQCGHEVDFDKCHSLIMVTINLKKRAFYLFVFWFNFPLNNVSVMSGLTSTTGSLCVLITVTVGFVPRTPDLKSVTLPLGHPTLSIRTDLQIAHAIRKFQN